METVEKTEDGLGIVVTKEEVMVTVQTFSHDYIKQRRAELALQLEIIQAEQVALDEIESKLKQHGVANDQVKS